jgi:uncharacterized protein
VRARSRRPACCSRRGVVDLLADAEAHRGGGGHAPFADFEAIAASSADAVEVPPGFRADVLISYGDEFARPDGTKLTYGYNNDFTAFMPLPGTDDEGLLFVNHEYNAPFFQHGQEDPALKTPEQIASSPRSTTAASQATRR